MKEREAREIKGRRRGKERRDEYRTEGSARMCGERERGKGNEDR